MLFRSEHGRGLLYVAGSTQPQEYVINAGSLGFQAGGQAKTVIYVFNTPQALQTFQNSNGWTIGIDATASAGYLGIIVIAGLVSAIMTFPTVQFAMGSLLASAGLASVIAGMAARSMLGNVFAGLQLATTDAKIGRAHV